MDTFSYNNNDQFELASGFINNSNQPVFLTGKAGTGKTTFLKSIKENSLKNCAIVAPTGVAAINAGGVTIHSFFQLPFTPYIPKAEFGNNYTEATDKHSLMANLRLTQQRREVLQNLELLIIDEISMVRADVLDAIDNVLRHVRNRRKQPYGGVQVLYIGDLYQLPPVVKEEEWMLLKEYYANPFFFSSKVIAQQPPVYIELKKVYRQHDAGFINILNQVRNNEMDEEGYKLLHNRLHVNPCQDHVITLTTHNATADQINRAALEKLQETEFIYQAEVEGDFTERIYPTDEFLHLKKGTQVMFLKNNTEKGYYNGKIGTVTEVGEGKIAVTCEEEDEKIIEVQKEVWRNVKYKLDATKSKIEEEVAGSFTQYPLRLAWAITIHKSQGLTFNQVIIDAQKAFAPGQVYVALSRCTTLEGIYLRSAIAHRSLLSDERIVAYSLQQQSGIELTKRLATAACTFQQEMILSLIDFSEMVFYARRVSDFIIQQPAFGKKSVAWARYNVEQTETFKKHGSKFSLELEKMFDGIFPEKNKLLIARLVVASKWFVNQLAILKDHLKAVKASTDNRQIAIDFTNRAAKLYEAVACKLYLLSGCIEGFELSSYQIHKAAYKPEKFPVTIYAASTETFSDEADSNLVSRLRNLRSQLAEDAGIPLYMICNTESLELMATYFPLTEKDLEKIKGFGAMKIKQYGKDFLEAITSYCDFFAIESRMHVMPEKKTRKKGIDKVKKPDTKLQTFDLYAQGKPADEIALIRNLTISTIESHLAYYIQLGKIPIHDILNEKDYREIKTTIQANPSAPLTHVKDLLPHFSYGKIKIAMAAIEYEQEQVN